VLMEAQRVSAWRDASRTMNSVETGRVDSTTDPRTRPLRRRRMDVFGTALPGFSRTAWPSVTFFAMQTRRLRVWAGIVLLLIITC